jgi:hypothetical protein
VLGGEVSDGTAAGLVATMRWVLGLDAPPAPTSWLEAVEPRIAPVTHTLHGFRTPCFPTLFETCAAELREIGLSSAKTSSLQSLARLTVDGTQGVDRLRALPTPEAFATLRAPRYRPLERGPHPPARLSPPGRLSRGQRRRRPQPHGPDRAAGPMHICVGKCVCRPIR